MHNAELHARGVGAPSLGLTAHRAAVILNAGPPIGRTTRTAWTSFAPPAAAPRLPDPDLDRAVPAMRGEVGNARSTDAAAGSPTERSGTVTPTP